VQRLGRETKEIDAELSRHRQALTQINSTIDALQQKATP
jgi:hypothetical protein